MAVAPQPLRLPLASIPRQLCCVDDYQQLASAHLPAPLLAWIDGGSGAEQSLAANRAAFAQLQLMPRLLACHGGSTALSLFGQPLAHPLLLAPVGHQQLVHEQGELATAAAAEATDTTLIVSTQSSFSLEQIAASGSGRKWFQLYLQGDAAIDSDLVARAVAAGYQALVLTLDTPIQALSRGAQRAGFALPAGQQLANLARYKLPRRTPQPSSRSLLLDPLLATAPRWHEIEQLLASCPLPVLIKGVCHPEDGRRLIEAGASALILSNHGGRALDGTPSPLQLLPAMRQALGPQVPLLVDGGIRSGYDLFKALACGADAALIGRPQLYALAVAGALGVAHLLKLMREELELCMALCGCPDLASINHERLWPAPHAEPCTPTHSG